MIKETEKISVLNYNENRVSVKVSPTESYSFEPSLDGINPTTISMTIDQIRFANNHNVFRNGFLFFDKSKEKDVYEIIGISDWENILTNDDIREIIIHPTFDGLNKLISIKDDAMFERVRAAYHKLKYENIYDISVRVAQIIETRYKELQNKKIHTSIVLEKKDIATPIDNKEVENLKSANEAMQKQLEEMQKMMSELLAKKDDDKNDTHNVVKTGTQTNKKKPK